MSCKMQKRPKIIPKLTETPMYNSEAERQFEAELCWCINQLERALRFGKLNSKQVTDHRQALNTLRSKAAPLPKKRQVMRLSFGDYRSKMAEESKTLKSVRMQLSLSTVTPNSNSIFYKKANSLQNEELFKFNFNVEGKASEETSELKRPSFHLVSSDNSFRFNFNVADLM